MTQSSATRSIDAAPVARAPWMTALRRRLAWLSAMLVVSAAGVGAFRYNASRPKPLPQYKTAAVARRNVVGRVTASGTLSAIVTVQVGTQVSGRIQKLNADFNSKVTKGQLVAKIDPQLFQAAAAQAEANYLAAQAGVAKADAEARIADRQNTRNKALYDENLAALSDVDNGAAAAESAHASANAARAALAQTRAALNQAQVNLSYTNILSPIDGVVISRSVDVGQTVAASLSAPILFTIAQDLTKMQVDTSVAEADVGRLQVGMATYFTVDAFPGSRFRGKIREIRNAAVMVQNVVTYDAVIDVENSDLRLRPGMTANVTIIFSERPSVLAVPNAALRFHGPAGAAARTTAGASPGAQVPSQREGGRAEAGGSGGGGGGGKARDEATDSRTLWVMRSGVAEAVSVHIGLSDGSVTEVEDGPLHEGDEVAIEAIDPSSPAPSGTGSNALRRLF